MPNKNSIEEAYRMVDKYFEAGGDPECILMSRNDFIKQPEVQALIQREVKKGRVEELKELLKPNKCYRPWCKVEHTNLRKRYVLDRLEELEG